MIFYQNIVSLSIVNGENFDRGTPAVIEFLWQSCAGSAFLQLGAGKGGCRTIEMQQAGSIVEAIGRGWNNRVQGLFG